MFNLNAHLRRRIASGSWIPELDGLRFIAIVSVVLFHMQGELMHHNPALLLAPRYFYLNRFFTFGYRGVPLFFMISGFILARPFAQHHLFGKPAPTLRKYFTRRVTRLEPPYVLNLIVLGAAVVVVSHQALRAALPHLFASIFYLHYLIYRDVSTLNPAAWSLEVEVQFYLIAPLLCMLFAIRGPVLRRWIIGSLAVASVATQLVFRLGPLTVLGELQYFLAGLLFTDLYLTVMPRWKHHWAWDVVSLLGWPVIFLVDVSLGELWIPTVALLLYVAAFRGVVLPRILRNPWIAVTGGMCYTLYLWHAPAMTLAERVLDKVPALAPHDFLALFVVQGMFKVLSIAAVCLPLFLLVERPCMDPQWPQKLMERMRGHSQIETSETPALKSQQG